MLSIHQDRLKNAATVSHCLQWEYTPQFTMAHIYLDTDFKSMSCKEKYVPATYIYIHIFHTYSVQNMRREPGLRLVLLEEAILRPKMWINPHKERSEIHGKNLRVSL